MTRLSVVVVVGLLCVALGTANADPMFSIHTQEEWERALGGMMSPGAGMIVPVGGMVFEQMVNPGSMVWPQEYDEGASFFTPLLAVAQGGYQEEPALIMEWGPPAQGGTPENPLYNAAAWDYVYNSNNHQIDGDIGGQQQGAPVDLNGLFLSFSIFPPWPSTFFSLNLVEEDPDRWREYIWHASGNTGDPIPGQWNTVTIDLSAGTADLNAIVFTSPSGFDLSSVARLRFDENVPFPAPAGWPQIPPPPLQNTDWVYNLWNHVEVSPEPGTMVLVGSGLLGLVLKRRRKK